MTLLSELHEGLTDAVDEYTSPPDHLYLRREPTSTATDDRYTATGAWWDTYHSDIGPGDDPVEFPYLDKHAIEVTGELRDQIHAHYQWFHDNVDIPAAEYDTNPSLVQIHSETDLGAAIDDDFAFHSLATGETQTHLDGAAFDDICRVLSDLDPDVNPAHVTEAEFVFSDRHESRLVNIAITLSTPNPHQYYLDIDSLDEYRSIASDIDSLDPRGELHSVFLRLRRDDGDIPESLVEYGEHRIRTLGHQHVETDVGYVIEAERLTYAPGERFAFFLHVPLTE